MHLQGLAALAALLGAVAAAPSSSSYVLHERRDLEHVTKNAWVKRSVVPVGQSLPVRIGLQQSNLDVGHDILMAV